MVGATGAGRLFIVGDAKQSIYRFRGADHGAYRRAVARVKEEGGVELSLTANFRSVSGVLGPINDLGRTWIPSDHLPPYEAIEVPRNSPTGFITAFFATFVGFALIWHIWWMAVLGLIGAYATFVAFAWRDVSESVISRDEVARIDRANRAARTLAIQENPA